MIPYHHWTPLSVDKVVKLFADAPFLWALAGGYAVELFLETSIRPHEDIDIIIFRDEQLHLQNWLKNWELYAADPPGTLRKWEKGEFLPYGIHDIWGHEIGKDVWQLQIMVSEVDNNEWVSRRSPLIRGNKTDLITTYQGVPCICIEVQLMYKAKGQRPKDEQDFYACLPKMSANAKSWLKEKLVLLYPNGHDWIQFL